MANDSVGVAAAASPTNYIDNESIPTGGSPATVDRQRVRVGGAGYTDLADVNTQGGTGQGAQVSAPAGLEVSFSTTTAQAVASTDCRNFRFVSVQVTSQGSGSAIAFQGSNDNSNWNPVQLVRQGSSGITTGSASSTNGVTIWVGALPFRYFRLNVTGITSGTTAGVIEFFSQALPAELPHIVIDWINSVGGATFPVVNNGSSQADGVANSNSWLLPDAGYFYNGATWDRRRGPNTFKTATATASGDTALWTPTSGKKFRLMRFKIEATADAATSGGGAVDVVLRDSTTATAAAMSFYAPATSVTTSPGVISTGWIDLGNGILSAAANNVLNINNSAALSSGKVRVVACGTEE